MNNAFPLAPGEMFRRGVEGFQRNPVALLLAGLLSIAGYAVFGIPAQQMLDDGDRVPALILNIVGLVLGGTLAHPWYVVALASDRGEKADLAAALRSGDRFFAQLVGSFWFWAAFILGIQYLAGIPSIVVLIFYSFYGFIVADLRYGGMRALGTSVRLGEGRRIGIFAIAAMYGVFNFAAFLPLGYAVNVGTIVLSAAVALVTTSITMVAGAALYETLKVDLPDEPVSGMPVPRQKSKNKNARKRK